MDKKGNNDEKFSFITIGELEKNVQELHEQGEENREISIVPNPKVVSVDKTPFEEEQYQEITNIKESAVKEEKEIPPKKRIYFSYETRVGIMVLLILTFFGVACFLILEALNFGDDEKVKYSEISQIDYQVCLNDSEYYGTSCLGEGMEYLSSLVDNIQVNYHYDVDFSSNIQYDLAYHIVAITKIYDKDDDQKVLYRNEEELVSRTDFADTSKKIQISRNVPVDFAKYHKIVVDYNERYGVESGSTLEVILFLDEPTETRRVATLMVPLGKPTFHISKDLIKKKNREVFIDNDEWNSYNTWCSIFAVFFVIISLFLLFKTTKLVLKVTTNRNKFQTALSNILREYDRLIVIARDGYESNVEKKVIKVDSFNDILDARDTLEKPIIYSKINDVKSEFIVEDEEKLYKYVIKESDF